MDSFTVGVLEPIVKNLHYKPVVSNYINFILKVWT